MELLNWTFAYMMEDKEPRERRYILAALEGRLGPNGGILVDDPDLPAEMQGQEAPAWWDDGVTDMGDTFTINLD